jgi:hypothetical protein
VARNGDARWRDLVVGSGSTFVDRGLHPLKGRVARSLIARGGFGRKIAPTRIVAPRAQ